MSNKIEKLKEIVDKSNNIVFFTGAGVSVASGILISINGWTI